MVDKGVGSVVYYLRAWWRIGNCKKHGVYSVENVFQTTQKNPSRASVVLARLRAFFNSYPFYCLETAAAIFFVLFEREVLGVLVFAALLCVLLLVCDDILPTTLPFLLVCIFPTGLYDSFDTFIVYVKYAPVVLACFAFHFVVYHKKFTCGKSIWGIYAVSIAILLGGIGRFTLKEYALGSYYVLGLSFGMLIAYILMRSEFMPTRRYDIQERFAVIMTLSGLLCVAMIGIGYYFRACGKEFGYYPYGFSPNNIATMLLFAMPFPLYLGRKRKWLALLTPLMFGFICITTSRGGLLMGCAEFAACCAYWIYQGKTKKKKIRRLLLCVTVIAVVLAAFGGRIWEIVVKRFVNEDMFESERFFMIGEAFSNFRENPFVGTGLLDDSISYGSKNKQGTMAWYHMMIPQVIESMGLIGVAAYGFQIIQRIKLTLEKTSWWSLCLGISYLGILLMSQVNPGEFCPVPYEVLTVLLFLLQERRFERRALWEKSL